MGRYTTRRGNDLLWTLGVNILLPRFCLFVLLPGLFVVPTAPHFPPLPWSYRGLPLAWAEGVRGNPAPTRAKSGSPRIGG